MDGSFLSNADEDGSWIRESELSWLEKFWMRKEKLKNIDLQTPSKINNDTVPARSFHSATRKRKSTLIKLGEISIPSLVKEEAVIKDQFAIRLSSSQGLGIEWKITNSYRVYVNDFYMINDRVGPGQACGLISVNDELIMINEKKLSNLSAIQLTEFIHSIDILAKVSFL
jgi:hypothetical protein